MKIVGVDAAVLGVEEVAAARAFYKDFGLAEVEAGSHGATVATVDGSSVVIRSLEDKSLPAAVTGGSTIREIVWAVETADALAAIADELAKDRSITESSDGTIHSVDDDGYAIAFRLPVRRTLAPPPNTLNIYGAKPLRPVNQRVDFDAPVSPLTIGHIVLFTPDVERSMRFYVDRLGFRISDYFRGGAGAFLRSASSRDHHTMFLIKQPATKGLHHISFHVVDFNQIMVAGSRLTKAGWQTQFGPGRHVIGSNCFWYFKSPCGGAMELSADMDQADDAWETREWDFAPHNVAAWSTALQTR